MPIVNRFNYHFNCKAIDEDYRIFKIISSKNCELGNAGAVRKEAADILVNAGMPILAAVYSGAKTACHQSEATHGVYLLVDKKNKKNRIDAIINQFDELCTGMDVQLKPFNHANILANDDPNGLANLLLYRSVNQINYSNVNGSLYYAIDDWINKGGKPRDCIKMIRLRFKANGVLCTQAETWQKLEGKEQSNGGPVFCNLEKTCRFKAMTPNDKTSKTRYVRKGIRSARASVPYLDFQNKKSFNASACGAIWNALELVWKHASRYIELTPVTYNNCESLKGASIAKYRVYSRNLGAFTQAWKNLVSPTSICICAGGNFSSQEKEKALPILQNLAESLSADGSVKVHIDLNQMFSDAIAENTSRIFIPVIHDQILKSTWNKIANKIKDALDLPIALFNLKMIQPMFDDHYMLARNASTLFEHVKNRTQYITIENILSAPKREKDFKKYIDHVARRIQIELLIKHDIEMGKLEVFDWERLDEHTPLTCVSRKKITFNTTDKSRKAEYERFVYAIMTIQPNGAVAFRSFLETTDENNHRIEQSASVKDDAYIAESFRREEQKIIDAYEYLNSRDIGELYIFKHSPDDGFLIVDSPEKILPDLSNLSEMLKNFDSINEKDVDSTFQEHLAAAWIAKYSSLSDEQLEDKIVNLKDQFPMTYETLFQVCEVNNIPEIKWRFARGKTPKALQLQEKDSEKKKREKQEIINRILAPYKFSDESAMKVCEHLSFYRQVEHKDDADLYQQFFGIRYFSRNHPPSSNALKKLDAQCGGILQKMLKVILNTVSNR